MQSVKRRATVFTAKIVLQAIHFLKALFFAKRAAKRMIETYSKTSGREVTIDKDLYKNYEDKYKDEIFEEIERRERNMNNITMALNADELILSALREDITSEDITTNSVMREYQLGEVELICKQDGVIAGLDVFKRTFELLDSKTEVTFYKKTEIP